MLSNILERLGFVGAERTLNIAFWGPDVLEITALVYSFETEGCRYPEPSIYPVIEEIAIDNTVIKAFIPGGNEGVRRSTLATGDDYDGVVYLIDNTDAESRALSKNEIGWLLTNSSISKPLLILVPTAEPSDSTDQEKLAQDWDCTEALTKGREQFAVFEISLVGEKQHGYIGLQWLVNRLSRR